MLKITFGIECGDGFFASSKACDDANKVLHDGCSNCKIDPHWTCSGWPSICISICGDGFRTGPELCDDGNVFPNDGCDSCVLEFGWECFGVPQKC